MNLSELTMRQLENEAREAGLWVRVRARELEYFLLHLPEAQTRAQGNPVQIENLQRVFAAHVQNLEEQLERVKSVYAEWVRRHPTMSSSVAGTQGSEG